MSTFKNPKLKHIAIIIGSISSGALPTGLITHYAQKGGVDTKINKNAQDIKENDNQIGDLKDEHNRIAIILERIEDKIGDVKTDVKILKNNKDKRSTKE